MRVLIIDDDPEDTSLFCEALYELYPDATCMIANTCENIHNYMRSIGEMDMIFLDGHMFPVEGKTCLQELLKIVDRKKTTIAIYSGGLSPAEQVEFEKIGADYILIKAGDYNELKARIGQLIARCSVTKPVRFT